MKITVDVNFDLDKLDIDNLVEMGIFWSLRRIQSKARAGAPVATWDLKEGIGIEVWKWKWRVWPRKIVYAVRREFENYKNPDRKFYMKRAYEDSPKIVQEEFDRAYNIVIKKIWVS